MLLRVWNEVAVWRRQWTIHAESNSSCFHCRIWGEFISTAQRPGRPAVPTSIPFGLSSAMAVYLLACLAAVPSSHNLKESSRGRRLPIMETPVPDQSPRWAAHVGTQTRPSGSQVPVSPARYTSRRHERAPDLDQTHWWGGAKYCEGGRRLPQPWSRCNTSWPPPPDAVTDMEHHLCCSRGPPGGGRPRSMDVPCHTGGRQRKRPSTEAKGGRARHAIR